VIFYKLNIDKAPEIKAAFNVENIPMILYFKPYGRVSTTVGYLNREKLEQMIAKLLLNS
jgi:thioredoxin-like negative regulator of GroEL